MKRTQIVLVAAELKRSTRSPGEIHHPTMYVLYLTCVMQACHYARTSLLSRKATPCPLPPPSLHCSVLKASKLTGDETPTHPPTHHQLQAASLLIFRASLLHFDLRVPLDAVGIRQDDLSDRAKWKRLLNDLTRPR